MIHAPLKNIQVDIKFSPNKSHGFNQLVLERNNAQADVIRKHDKSVAQVQP
jgi:hypothetical protein